jgi:hypothetical protein
LLQWPICIYEEFYLQKWGILVATLSNFIMQQIQREQWGFPFGKPHCQ